MAIKVSGTGRKRFRTKFSQDQKEKMMGFAEKIGWKMQRCDDKMVMDFCNDIGIRRGIFKVWMHNNKNTLAPKKQITTGVATDLAISNDSSHQQNASGDVHLQDSTHGSSSSS